MKMKKALTTILLAACCAMGLQAQNNVRPLPFSTNFEDPQDDSWQELDVRGINKWVLGTGVGSNSGRCLFVSNDEGISNAYSTSSPTVQLAYIDVELPFDSIYSMAFDWRGYGELAHDFMRVALIPSSYDCDNLPTMYTSYSAELPSGWIALDGGAKCRSNSWKHELHAVEASVGTYKLAIIWANDGAGGIQPPAAIDNIELRLVTCPAPQHISAYSTSTSTAEVNWTVSGTATTWLVEHGPQGFAQGTGIEELADATHFTVTGLSQSQTYDIYVRPICAGADTGMSIKTTVTTSCYDGGYQDFPFREGFEGAIPCWSQLPLIGNELWATASSFSNGAHAQEGSSFIKFQTQTREGYSSMLVTPILNLGESDSARIRFAHMQPAWGSDQDVLTLAYRIHPDSAWIEMRTWTDNITSWQSENLRLPQLSSTLQIGFIGTSNYGFGIGIDNVMVTGNIPCNEPIITHVSADINAIDLEWTSEGEDMEIAIKASTDNDWPEEIQITGHAYTFLGLDPNTSYDFRIRQICPDGVSEWAEGSTSTLEIPEDPQCDAPTNIQVVSMLTSATIMWDGDGNVDEWDVIYSTIGQTMGSNTFFTTRKRSFRIADLRIETDYGVCIRAHCSNGLTSSWSTMKRFRTGSPRLDIAESESVQASIYPNPARNSATIDLGENGQELMGAQLELIDRMGRVAYACTIDREVITLSLEKLPKGIYMARIVDEHAALNAGRLIIE